MKTVYLLVSSFLACFLILPTAQSQDTKERTVIVKKQKKSDSEQNVWVNVSENNGEKQVKVKLKDQDGNEKIYEWYGDDIPKDIKEELGEMDINVLDIDQDESFYLQEHQDIHVEVDEGGHKKVKIEIKGKDGKDELIELEGEGEIPAQIKEKIHEHGEHVIILDKEQLGEDHFIDIKTLGDGDEKIKIKIKSKDGEVFEWMGDEDIPEDVLKKSEMSSESKPSM